MLDPELASAQYEDGHLDASPAWIRVINIAKWMGVEPWALAEQDDIWMDWASCLMQIEHKAHEQAQRRARKGGNK